MSQEPWGEKPINKVSGTSMAHSGCAITLIANMAAMVSKSNINPAVINNKAANFQSKVSSDLHWDNVGQNTGLTITRSKNYGSIASQIAAAQKLLHEAEISPEKMFVGVYVPITTSKGVQYHWVGVDGDSITDFDGIEYLKVSATSNNDNKNRTNNSNWKEINGDMYVRADSVQGTVTATNSDPKSPDTGSNGNSGFWDTVKDIGRAIVDFVTGSKPEDE